MYYPKLKSTLLGCCALGASSAVHAQSDENVIIVTATGVEQSVSDTGTSISVISEEEILDQQSVSVSELLQELPGVNVTQSGSFGSQTSVRIRGAESDQTLVLVNGIRVNDPSAPDGSFDFGNMLTENIERIEVLRGANSVAWGSQAVGGVVNITTARPSEDFQLFAQGEYGANDTRRLNSNISGKIGPIGLVLGGGYFETDGISAFSRGTEDDGYRQYSANGRLEFELTENIRFEANVYYADSQVENDSVFPPFSSDNGQFSTAEEFYGNAVVVASFADGRFNNRFAFSLSDINRDIINPFFTSLPRGRSERLEYRGDFAINDQVQLIFGGEIEDSRYENTGVTDATGIDSIFLQAVLKPIENLTLTSGVRHDDHQDFGGRTSFAANFSYQLNGGNTVFRGSYAEGFRAPSLIDLDDRPFGFGTPDLRPETAKSYELGIEQKFLDRRVTFGVKAFLRYIDDQIAFAACPIPPDPAPAVCTNGNRPFGTTLNIEKTRTQGVEATVDIKPAENFHVQANYTYLDTENRSAGANFSNQLARRPSSSFYLNANYETSFGLKVGADMQIVGDSFDDLANGRRIDGFALVGVRAAMPMTENIELFGRIDNLFDVTYETAIDFGTLGQSAYIGARTRF